MEQQLQEVRKKELEPIVQAQELIYVMNQLWPTAQLAQEQEN